MPIYNIDLPIVRYKLHKGLFIRFDFCFQPIIESSSKLRIGCLQFCYDSLPEHMKLAALSPWQNFWWKVR